jgi:hypothetical protein
MDEKLFLKNNGVTCDYASIYRMRDTVTAEIHATASAI